MRQYPSDIAFTHAVKAVQAAKGSRDGYAKAERRGWRTRVNPDLAEFLAGLDMFYLGTASAEGQPYIQYRGGSPGFLKVLDEKTLAFADFGGNRQYLTVGNLSENPKAFLFLMDYANRQRVKVWGRARVVENDPKFMEKLVDPGYRARPERAIRRAISPMRGRRPPRSRSGCRSRRGWGRRRPCPPCSTPTARR